MRALLFSFRHGGQQAPAAPKPEAQNPDLVARAQAQLAALHARASGFAPKQAREVQAAFHRALGANPSSSDAQAGLLQILRERAVAETGVWPHRRRHAQSLQRQAIAQLGALLRGPKTQTLIDVLQHADELWAAPHNPQTQALLARDVLDPLGEALQQSSATPGLDAAILRACARLAVLQPWCLPQVMLHIASRSERAALPPSAVALLPSITQRALAAPMGLAQTVTVLAARTWAQHSADGVALLACCQMLHDVLLPCRPTLDVAREAVRLVQAVAVQLPGEAPAYAGLRLLLQTAQGYDEDDAIDAATLAHEALEAASRVLEATEGMAAQVVLRGMAERTLLELERGGRAPLALVATRLLTHAQTRRRITAPRVA